MPAVYGGRRKLNQGYRRIRWKTYDPSESSKDANVDGFVQWQPLGLMNGKPGVEEEGQRILSHDAERRHEQASISSTLALSPIQPLPSNGTRVDPFLCLPIKATDCVQDTMDYFITICKGTGTVDSPIFGSVNPHLSLLLPFALKHSVLFESIIAVCRASILLSLGRPAFEDAAFVQHRGNAISGLNTKIRSKDCADDVALLTVTMLMTLEYLVGNQRGVRMHCNGLDKMLQLRGPLSLVEDPGSETEWIKFVKFGLVAYKSLGSFVTGQPPELPPNSPGYIKETFQQLNLDQPLSYPAIPFPAELCLILSRLPPGLSDLCLKSGISTQMINILASISATTALLPCRSPPVLEPPADGTDREEERRQVMIQTLLSSLQRVYLMTTSSIEYHLTSGLLSYLFQFRSLEPLNLFYDPILRNFIQSLPHHTIPSASEEKNCMIWSSVSVAGALALRVVTMPDSHTVMDYALETYPEMREWRPLEKVLRSFAWTDNLGMHWKHVWDVAMDRRRFYLQHRRTAPHCSNSGLRQGLDDSLPFPTGEESTQHMRPEQVREHIAGAPKSMHKMGRAMGLCPFRPEPSTNSGCT